MAKQAAGILIYRSGPQGPEVLLVHPGGPLWAGRDDASWSVPKGEPDPGEDLLAAAEREFAEEVGFPTPPGPRIDLGEIRQASGKRVRVWAVEGDLDATASTSNWCDIEWPRGSGFLIHIPEVDRAEWCSLPLARRKLVPAQAEFVDRLADRLVHSTAPDAQVAGNRDQGDTSRAPRQAKPR